MHVFHPEAGGAQDALGIVRSDGQPAQRGLGDAREERAPRRRPPSLAGPRGVSSETSTTSAGCEAGTNPTNDATWSIIE